MAKYGWNTQDKRYKQDYPDQELELVGTTYSLSGITSQTRFYSGKIVVENGRRRDNGYFGDDTTMPDPWESVLQEKKW